MEPIGREGRRAFYKGDIAKTITAELLFNDGVLSREDFANHTADWVDPISVAYRDYTAFNLPPNTQGMAALGIFDILNNFDLSQVAAGSAPLVHLLADAV